MERKPQYLNGSPPRTIGRFDGWMGNRGIRTGNRGVRMKTLAYQRDTAVLQPETAVYGPQTAVNEPATRTKERGTAVSGWDAHTNESEMNANGRETHMFGGKIRIDVSEILTRAIKQKWTGGLARMGFKFV
jgi:hypothetical protein